MCFFFLYRVSIQLIKLRYIFKVLILNVNPKEIQKLVIKVFYLLSYSNLNLYKMKKYSRNKMVSIYLHLILSNHQR